jgi:hypothetical protein
VILFECKFGEIDGGVCSQTLPVRGGTHDGLIQCNRNYEMQENPLNRVSAHCALTGKGIRYWELIPSVFQLDSKAEYRPCPFDGPWYQWMRNLVLAEEIHRSEGRQAGFVIVYADHTSLPFPRKLASPQWAKFVQNLRMSSVKLHTISYQELLGIAIDAVGSSNTKWRDLEAWVRAKIGAVGESAKTGRTRDASGNKVFGRFLNHKPFVFDARISQKALSGWASRGTCKVETNP